MTCIVGIIAHDNSVWIGGDSAGVGGYKLTIRKDEKVFKKGEFIFGFTSSFRMGQLIRYSFSPPKRHEGSDLFEYMATAFIDAIRECFKAGGYARKKNDEEQGGCFMVGYRGRLFVIYDDYQVEEPVTPYAAVGCGDDIAYGSLYTTHGGCIAVDERIKTALSAAEQFSAGVRGPFVVESIPGTAAEMKTGGVERQPFFRGGIQPTSEMIADNVVGNIPAEDIEHRVQEAFLAEE